MCPSSVAPCPSGTNVTFFLEQNNALVIFYHQYYELFTSALVTDYALDAAFNAIAVLVIDRITYDTMNKPTYLLVFFLTAIFGNLLTLLWGPNYASAGASGGIFGVFAAILSYEWAQQRKIDSVPLAFFLLIFVGSSILADVNWVAHVGGAIGGFIAGPLLSRMAQSRQKETGTEVAASDPRLDLLATAIIFLIGIASVAQFLIFAAL